MSKTFKIQIAVITGSLALFAVLLFANTTPPKKEANSNMATDHKDIDLDKIMANEQSALNASDKQRVKDFESKAEAMSDEAKLDVFDSIIQIYDNAKKPVTAAYVAEKKSLVKKGSNDWFEVGKRYYSAIGFVTEDQRALLYDKAISSYSKAAELDPQNADIRTALAVCYVEGSDNPMQGITMLREIVAADSTNIAAQMNLGLFGIKSEQYDKAVERFKKVLEVDQNYLEAYLYLADCYERLNNKQGAIESLEKYMSKVEDVTVKTQVQNYINKLSQG